MLSKSFFVFICLGLLLGQVGRVDLGNNVAITVLDIAVGSYVFYFIVLLIFRKVHIAYTPFSKFFLLFIILCIASLVFNGLHYSQLQFSVAFLYIFRFFVYGITLIALHSTLFKQKMFIKRILLFTGVGLLVGGFIQYFFYPNLRNLYYLGWDEHIYRLFSSFLDPNFMGAFFVLFFLFLAGEMLELKREDKYKKYVYSLLSLVSLVAIFLTYSRSAYVMLLISSIIFFGLRKKFIYIVFIVLCLVFMYVAIAPSSKVESTNLLRTTSTNERVSSMTTAMQIFVKTPILGIGFDAYRYAQSEFGYSVKQTIAYNHAGAGVDNSFMYVLVTTGLVGFVAYLLLQRRIILVLWEARKNSIISQVLLASIIGLYADSLIINSLFYPSILIWIVSLLAINDYK